MVTRRRFLRGTLVATLGIPVAAAAAPGASAAVHRTRVFVMAGCGEGEAFCDALPVQAEEYGWDIGEMLQAAGSFGAQPDYDFCIGLGRSSDYLPARQVLLEHGLCGIYTGRHDFGGNGWRHELSAGPGVVIDIEAALRTAGASWPAGLAALGNTIARSEGTGSQRILLTAASAQRPRQSHLVSWAFIRKPA